MTGLAGAAENMAAVAGTAADNAVANGIIQAGEQAGAEGVVNAAPLATPAAEVAAENSTNTVGALEDWSNVDYAARYAARDNAWETDNAVNIHGNSASSPRTAFLYGLYDKATNQLMKWGVTQNPASRYTREFMQGKYLDLINNGPRSDMLQLERNLVETNPGPLNFEPWAGSQAGGQP